MYMNPPSPDVSRSQSLVFASINSWNQDVDFRERIVRQLFSELSVVSTEFHYRMFPFFLAVV